MPPLSAGILLYRLVPRFEVFIGHMGGPFWEKKDAAAWSIPKGLYDPDEEPLAAAIREFEEEIGVRPPALDYAQLGEFRQASGKRLTVFSAAASEMQFVASNTFETEWPLRSGRMRSFAEIDRADWHPIDVARTKVVKGQIAVLDELEKSLG